MSDVQSPAPKTPGSVITAFVLSLFGFVCGLPAVAGLVLGIRGLSQARRAGKGHGLAVASIVISAIWLVLVAVVAVRGIVGGLENVQRSSAQGAESSASDSGSSTSLEPAPALEDTLVAESWNEMAGPTRLETCDLYRTDRQEGVANYLVNSSLMATKDLDVADLMKRVDTFLAQMC
jgi:hypothetical protein